MPQPLAILVISSKDLNGLLMLVASGAFFLTIVIAVLWSNWKKYTPRGFVFFCATFLCMGLAGMSAVFSTFPSSAPREVMQGRLAQIQQHGQGRSKSYTFALLLDGGSEKAFRAPTTLPFFAHGELLSVEYLDENVSGDYPRAIAIDVLTGPRSGWHSSVSADWLGSWIGVPVGAVAGIALLILASKNIRPNVQRSHHAEEVTSLGLESDRPAANT